MSSRTNGKMAVVSHLFQYLITNKLFITGHFERRISFGCDADLVHVRADFDGLMLRIMVPRRISPVSLHTAAPIAATALGRA